jgi:Transglycosylase SLT domain
VIVAIAALAAGLIYAYKHSQTFRTIVDGTFKAIRGAVGTAINFIIGMFKAWFDTSATVVLGILHAFGKLPGPMGAPFRKAEQAVKDAKKTVDDQLGKIQKRVDQLSGKDIPVSASLKLNFSPSFTQKDWVDVRLAAGRMAGGGLLAGPGTATSDSIPLWGSKGEYIVNAAATSRWLPVLKWINADRKAAGGPIGQIGAETGAIDKLEAWGVGRRMSAGIDKLLSSGAMVGGSLGVWIAAALALTHSPPSWASRLAVLVRRESGGNPRAINLTDSNARAGHPSQGLAQTIPATFRAYHQSGTSWNILDPVANLAAALNYIKAVYGSIFNVQQANPNLPPRGYRSGAWNIAADQLAVLHRGEMVVPAPAAAAVRARGGLGGGALPAPTLIFNIAGDLDQAAAARVEQHVDAKMRELYRTLVAA